MNKSIYLVHYPGPGGPGHPGGLVGSVLKSLDVVGTEGLVGTRPKPPEQNLQYPGGPT